MSENITTMYEITEAQQPQNYRINKVPQPHYYTMANLVGIFVDYFKSIFDRDFFKSTRLTTEENFKVVFKGLSTIKEKPILFIDHTKMTMNETSLYYQNVMKRFNQYDPQFAAATDMYSSLNFYDDGVTKLSYRPIRYTIQFDVLMTFSTYADVFDAFNHLTNKLRHESKFSIDRYVLVRIPTQHIQNIAKFNKMDYKSEDFMNHLNAHCALPIIKRTYASGHLMFFMIMDRTLAVEVPNIPSMDGFSRNGMVDAGGNLTDIVSFDVELPGEMMMVFPETMYTEVIKVVPDANDILFISPYKSKMDIEDEGPFKLVNRIDAMPDSNGAELNILDVIDNPTNIEVLKMMIDAGRSLSDLVMIKVLHENNPEAFTFDNKGTIKITNPDITRLYDICIMMNIEAMNKIKISLREIKIGSLTL